MGGGKHVFFNPAIGKLYILNYTFNSFPTRVIRKHAVKRKVYMIMNIHGCPPTFTIQPDRTGEDLQGGMAEDPQIQV